MDAFSFSGLVQDGGTLATIDVSIGIAFQERDRVYRAEVFISWPESTRLVVRAATAKDTDRLARTLLLTQLKALAVRDLENRPLDPGDILGEELLSPKADGLSSPGARALLVALESAPDGASLRMYDATLDQGTWRRGNIYSQKHLTDEEIEKWPTPDAVDAIGESLLARLFAYRATESK